MVAPWIRRGLRGRSQTRWAVDESAKIRRLVYAILERRRGTLRSGFIGRKPASLPLSAERDETARCHFRLLFCEKTVSLFGFYFVSASCRYPMRTMQSAQDPGFSFSPLRASFLKNGSLRMLFFFFYYRL